MVTGICTRSSSWIGPEAHGSPLIVIFTPEANSVLLLKWSMTRPLASSGLISPAPAFQ